MHSRVGTSTNYNLVLTSTSWKTVLFMALGFWLSSSLMLDLLIMPGLYATGMISQPEFAGAGYLIFWFFNRVELICAALIVTGILVLRRNQDVLPRRGYIGVLLSLLLLVIPLIYIYGLTPQMSALGLQLDLFNPVSEVPEAMNQLHEGYWMLEIGKLILGGTLLSFCSRDRL